MSGSISALSAARFTVIDAIRRGHQTVNALAAALGVTDNAVRLQLAVLERDGLLRRRGVRHTGRAGQPAAEYALTELGDDALSRAYQPALTALIAAISARLDARGLRTVLADAGRNLGKDLKPQATGSLASRAAACASLIESLGGSATVTVGRGQATVQGNSCPLAAAVRAEPATCSIVEALLEQQTGVSAVQRCEHGPRPRCRFDLTSRRP